MLKIGIVLALLALVATAAVGIAQQTTTLPPTASNVSDQARVDQSTVPSAELHARLDKQTRRLGRGRVVDQVWAMRGSDCFVVVTDEDGTSIGDEYGVVTDDACLPQVEALVRKLEAQR